MQSKTNSAATPSLLPKTLTFETAAHYSGLSIGTLEAYAKAGHITVYNMIQDDKTRGRKLIDRASLDRYIESCIGNVTTAPICQRKGRTTKK